MKAKQIPPKVREALWVRSGYDCERCREERATQAHHRRPRGSGGSRRDDTNTLPNLLALCLDCHAHIESHRAEAFTYGWLCRQSLDPARMPVLRRGEWVHLDADGGVTPIEDLVLVALSQELGFGIEGAA